MRIVWGLMVFTLFFTPITAQIEPDIDRSCNEEEVPVISISDPSETYSHPAEPGYFNNQLCIKGISSSSIQQENCNSATGFHLTGREDNSHFSTFNEYRLNVCTEEMVTRVTSESGSCKSDEKPLFSISGKDNGHIASPGVFDRLICGEYATPENVTVKVEFNLTSEDNVNFDQQEVNEEEEFQTADFPAFTVEGDQMTSGVISREFTSASRNINQKNTYSFKTGFPSSVIIPFNSGNRDDILNRRELILENRFLNQIKPSFENQIPEESIVRAIYSPELNLESNISQGPGRIRFNVTKIGDEKIGLYR